jgi:hypothetical protein
MTSDGSPAIVVVAFERPDSLARLLRSLAAADYEKCGEVPLVISLDGGGSAAARAEAARFEWEHGPLRIIERSRRLGLREHVLACGDLSQEYGAVIVLEDDLFVSPGFYRYALRARAFYGGEDRISGISLYTDDYNEYAKLRFVPFDDGFDNHFIQSASSRGQMWTDRQWRAFRSWQDSEDEQSGAVLPAAVTAWPDSSWKKDFIRYVSDTDRYVVYPRTSLSTNFGDAGTHYPRPTDVWQVPLQLAGSRAPEPRFSTLEDSLSVYDNHYEFDSARLRSLSPALAGLDFACDFYGSKDPAQLRCEWMISVRECSRPERGYGFELVPAEANALYDVRGSFFSLAPRDRFGALPLRKRALQFRQLHKNGGFKRYAALALEALRERLLES